jgi:hypothetical protein
MVEDLERGGVVERSENEEMLEWVVERGQDADERESGDEGGDPWPTVKGGKE